AGFEPRPARGAGADAADRPPAPRPARRRGARPRDPRPDRPAPAPHRPRLRPLPRAGGPALRLRRRGRDQVPRPRIGPPRRNAAARRLLRPPASPGAGEGPGAAGGLLRGRQPGSRVQVPGGLMSRANPAEGPVQRLELRRSWSQEWSALAALFVLTIRQHTHGRRMIVLGLLYALPCALAVLLRSLARPAPAFALEEALV